MKRILSLAILAILTLMGIAAFTGCDTVPADPTSDSTPAASHFKAQLAAGYGTLQIVRVGLLNAGQSGALDVKKVAATQTQLKAFQATLDLLRTGGATPANQSNLQLTLTAISALEILVTVSQGVQK